MGRPVKQRRVSEEMETVSPVKILPMRSVVLMILVGTTTSMSDITAQEDQPEQHRACAALGAAHVESAKTEWGRDCTNREVRTFV